MRHCFRVLFTILFLHSLTAFAQQNALQVNGKVTDQETGQNLAEVSVKVAGTKSGTTSAKDGTFSLQFPTVPAEVTLVFTHVAYQPVQVKLKPGQTYVEVQLKPKALLLEEVEIATVKN
ncbi:carboxypeptidase-like regulatory domain-containing protein [Adhaeribacter soli]|uniref:Carboxypeptidase-like regulatory domain-containing protein n=1 Tax=Adhaeribacter soli TaxID=2607655 RepID=A0A5N1J0G4_9BACT|nr:carboxypeptidase-like regulatory domain-containing protein [Adhaeribacter soli]KAA9340031.1 hypothetical protein F0P94_06690 [Adhaeribacter soli]